MPAGAVPGLTGTLFSAQAAADWLAGPFARPVDSAAAAIAQWASTALNAFGPSMTGSRGLVALEGLFDTALGFSTRHEPACAVAAGPSGEVILLFGFGWQRPLALTSRAVLQTAAELHAGWAIGFNGAAIGIADTRADVPRRMAAIDLQFLAADARTALFAASILSLDAFASGSLAAAVRASDESSRQLKDGLRAGVGDAVEALSAGLPFSQAVGLLFRMLFVLFAEGRSLVPMWHRVYRDHYSLAAIAGRTAADNGRGAWAALEGSRRLLRSGCSAGTLHVTAFNGRLFDMAGPRRWAASASLESPLDAPAARALSSLVTYRPARGGARRVNYAELDVEELGSIYERVLDLEPAPQGRPRKESGSFYTPRPLTEFVVRRTLAPLVSGATSNQLLSLRIVDPAMGSGAFLVAALRYLTAALERSLIAEGTLPEGDVTEADRRQLRRLVSQRCLYGVDANPTATLLAKLSLWLATLAAERPLGFLDHRLKCGNSLAGVDPFRARYPPRMKRRSGPLPLFDEQDCIDALQFLGDRATQVAGLPEDTLAEVRRKQNVYASIDDGRLEAWRSVCDTWCAWWFLPVDRRPDVREYTALADCLVRGTHVLPRRRIARRLRDVAACRIAHGFFHWPLEFPEVFRGPDASAGFDAVIGNPPWEMLRAGSGSMGRVAFTTFARESGLYRCAAGHLNLYQLFLERSLGLLRPGGRIGMILPWGLMTDEGAARLRAQLLDGTRIDTLARFDNTHGLFQAHRSLRFAALTATTAASTEAFEMSRERADARSLDDVADLGVPGRGPVITRAALTSLGGRSRRVPDVADEPTLALAVRLTRAHRALGDPAGWGAAFGRELNLTDDRGAFGPAGMPVLEGKHLHPGRIDITSGCHRIARARAMRLLPDRPFDRPRLAYRDVTAATNHQTVIAAIVPAGMVTTHTIFCLRNAWDARTLRILCVILNSRVANFLIRLFVGSHLTTSLMEWLPVPERAAALAALGRRKLEPPELEAAVARLYGLTEEERAAI